MPSIYKPTGMKRYRIAYKDENGKRKTTWGYKDKAASLARAKDLERTAERKHAGLRTTAKKRIGDARYEYLNHLQLNGTDMMGTHYKETNRILTAIICYCGWHYTTDINNQDFQNYLANMIDRAPRTRNRHQETLRAFLNYCVRMDWLEENPIARLRMAPVGQAGRRHHRRAFTLEEFQKLLEVTPEPRRTIYAVAGLSGLRRSELAKLETHDFTLSYHAVFQKGHTAEGKWQLRSTITKNKKTTHLPMLPECAQELSAHCRGWLKHSTVFQSIPHVWTLRADMKRAGIERVDKRGKRLDFHSFRYFFCTLLAKHLPIQEVQRLMRHSTIKLTADLYNDLGLEDLTAKVQRLPRLLTREDEPPAQPGTAPQEPDRQ